MQTKNVNLVHASNQNEAQPGMAFRASMNGSSSQDIRSSVPDTEGRPHPMPTSAYLPIPSNAKQIQASALPNGYPDLQTSFGGVADMGILSHESRSSSVYQPPPLPPRVGNSLSIREAPRSPSKRDPLTDGVTMNGSCGPYKPVPPPKPFAGNQIITTHHLQPQQPQDQHRLEGNETLKVNQNGHLSYPHILVTDQGQFVTHSSKFPITNETDKFVKRFNEANSSSNQGIDNPALIVDNSMGANTIQRRDRTQQNHYTPMHGFDPMQPPPPGVTNGHVAPFHRAPYVLPYQPPEVNWQTHSQANSVRFAPPVGQNTDRKPCMNGNAPYAPNLRERCPYPTIQQERTRDTITYSPGKNPTSQYQETNQSPANESNFKYQDVPTRIPVSETNGSVHNGKSYTINGTLVNGDQDKGILNNGVNGTSHGDGTEETEPKKEDKWGSLKRAGKKYSNFKSMISNKFVKPDSKSNSADTNGPPQTQNKGTNSHEFVKNAEAKTNGEILNSEKFHNGENHLQENESFQRTLTYGSLKSKLDGSPHHYDPAPLGTPERQARRLLRNPNGSFPSHSAYGRPEQIPTGSRPNGILAQKRAGSCSHLGSASTDPPHIPVSWAALHRSDDNLTRPLASDQSYPERNPLKPNKDGIHVHFHSSRDGTAGTGGISGGSDSGRGTGGGGSATEFKGHDTSLESGSSNRVPLHGHSSGNESEWLDIPETDEQSTSFRKVLHNGEKYPDGNRTPPLPPLLPEGSPNIGRRASASTKKQMDSLRDKKQENLGNNETSGTKNLNGLTQSLNPSANNTSSTKGRWGDRFGSATSTQPAERELRVTASQGRFGDSHRSRGLEWRPCVSKKYEEDDDLISTDAALDLNSVLDGATEVTTDDDQASAREDQSYLIRRQLEGLEGMYSEVLKVLGGRRSLRHPEPRLSRRRTHGSVSSLPSSVMSGRGVKDRRGRVIDDRLRRASKDISKTTHRRFQRLESHVVTLARSVAHLSSEMRTQQLMLQEIESIRSDLSALKVNVTSPPSRGGPFRGSRLWNGSGPNGPPWNNPGRVKKLTQFFGDEPPLVRIFLRKLGYEKYATAFEKEKIGMLELPYMTEERLHKIGIPLGPRLRILEESRGPITTDGNLSVYVV